MIKKYIPKQAKASATVRRIAIKYFNAPIKVWYWRDSFTNFGDELTPDIIQKLFDKKTIRVDIEDADLFAVGSIIEVIDRPRKKKAFIWGSGFMSAGGNINNPMLIFCAVRGHHTKKRLPRKYAKVAVGDPGLLSSLIYKRSSFKTNKIGIIPHFVDEGDTVLNRAKKLSDAYVIISVKSPPDEVARQITECRVVLSSSLHGLIVSDSFGVPNIHMPLSNKVVGGEFKFRDYYSSINKEYVYFNKKDLYDSGKIDRVIQNYEPIKNLRFIQEKLIKEFPFI